MTFNSLLREAGIDPKTVCLLRHTGNDGSGKIPLHQFRENSLNDFEDFQRTQKSGQPLFVKSSYWAAFVADQESRTIFVGLYRAKRIGSVPTGWIDPFRGVKPGTLNGKPYDLFETELCSELKEQIDNLEVNWSVRRWDVYAANNDFSITSRFFVDQFDLHHELIGEAPRKETTTNIFIRNPKVREAALLRANGNCEHCGETGFAMAGGRVYLATHHIKSLAEGGPDHISNVIALCPNHHREAHHGQSRDGLSETFRRVAAKP